MGFLIILIDFFFFLINAFIKLSLFFSYTIYQKGVSGSVYTCHTYFTDCEKGEILADFKYNVFHELAFKNSLHNNLMVRMFVQEVRD